VSVFAWEEPALNLRLDRRRRANAIFTSLCLAAIVLAILFLVILLVEVLRRAWGWVDLQFITSYPSRFPAQAGVLSALVGSIWLVVLTALFAVPVGIATAVYLEEYAPAGRWRDLIQVNISNLAGVPSIVYGLLGLGLFVRTMMLGRSLLAGALTMGLLVLPIVIVAAQEAIRAVPPTMREASFALGATRWQTVRHHVLPAALPGILTGVILAVSRALGEAAPLITIGALTFVPFLPDGPLSAFTVLPIQIFNWTSRPQDDFQRVAAAGIVVLLVLLLTANAVAILVRDYHRRKINW